MRYDDMLDKGPESAPRKTKMLRHRDLDGMHLFYEEWWVDGDGYPTHPVDASDDDEVGCRQVQVGG
jgi:hypothetical protein